MSNYNNLPNVADLVPHDAPMILINDVIKVDDNSIHCQVLINENSQFFDLSTRTINSYVGIEYMAQSISAWSGYQNSLINKPSPIGFLLGSRRYNTESDLFNEGDILDIYAKQLMESEGMSAFSCTIKCKNILLASAQLNVFVPNESQLEEMLKGKGND